MEVDRRPDDVDLGVHQAPQAERDRRQVALEEARVADDRDVGGEARAFRLQPVVEVRRAGLLLALEHVLQVHREAPAGRQDRGGGHHVSVDLALVVGRPAGQDPVADDDRLERRGGPQVERVDRLDVVVAVDEDRRRARARGASPRRRPGGRPSRRPRHARGPPPRAGRPATRRPDGNRRDAAAAPRCSGCAGSPCTNRVARRSTSSR